MQDRNTNLVKRNLKRTTRTASMPRTSGPRGEREALPPLPSPFLSPKGGGGRSTILIMNLSGSWIVLDHHTRMLSRWCRAKDNGIGFLCCDYCSFISNQTNDLIMILWGIRKYLSVMFSFFFQLFFQRCGLSVDLCTLEFRCSLISARRACKCFSRQSS